MTSFHGNGAIGAVAPVHKRKKPDFWDASFEDTALYGDGFNGERIILQTDKDNALDYMQQLHRDMCESDSVTHDERTIILHGFVFDQAGEQRDIAQEKHTFLYERTKYGTEHHIF